MNTFESIKLEAYYWKEGKNCIKLQFSTQIYVKQISKLGT